MVLQKDLSDPSLKWEKHLIESKLLGTYYAVMTAAYIKKKTGQRIGKLHSKYS